MTAATSTTDGCTNCAIGYWTGTGQKTSCIEQHCPAGWYSTKEAATSNVDGCNQCNIGK